MYPSSNGNVEFELAGADEVFRSLDELLLVPCCPNIYLSVRTVYYFESTAFCSNYSNCFMLLVGTLEILFRLFLWSQDES